MLPTVPEEQTPLTNGEPGQHSSAPQKNLPDLPPPKIVSVGTRAADFPVLGPVNLQLFLRVSVHQASGLFRAPAVYGAWGRPGEGQGQARLKVTSFVQWEMRATFIEGHHVSKAMPGSLSALRERGHVTSSGHSDLSET